LRPLSAPATAIACLLGCLLGAALLAGPAGASVREPGGGDFADETLRVTLPAGWRISGVAGEYQLESESEEIASLLILSPEPDRALAERLAEIEEQFLSTGIIALEAAEQRIEDHETVHYRRYRLDPAGAMAGATPILLHQYSFRRAGCQILLQIETAPGLSSREDLFFRLFQTLEVRAAPEPFVYEDPDPE
jgi:hypothetical protein